MVAQGESAVNRLIWYLQCFITVEKTAYNEKSPLDVNKGAFGGLIQPRSIRNPLFRVPLRDG